MPPAEEVRPDLRYSAVLGQSGPWNNDSNMEVKTAFGLFFPSLQQTWADELEELRLGANSSNLMSCTHTLYSTWCSRYNFDALPDNEISEARNGEQGSELIPLDLLRKLIQKFTKDGLFAVEKFRSLRTLMNWPEKECGTALHHLPLDTQKIVKKKLLNSVPYPGTLPPELWDRFPSVIAKTNAPSIDTSGIDTYLRIARALVAHGLPMYLPMYLGDGDQGFSFTNALEAAVWTDIGQDTLADWVMKANLLRFNHASLATYLHEAHHTMIYWDKAASLDLYSRLEARFSSRHIIPSTKEGAVSIAYFNPYPQRKGDTSVEIVKHGENDRDFKINFSPDHADPSSPATFQESLDRFFGVREDGMQLLCDFPEFMMVNCGGELGVSRQRCSEFVHINAMSYNKGHGFSYLSCLYELKIVWRLSSEWAKNGLPEQSRNDDCHIYDSERYQARSSQRPGVGDQDWTIATSPVEYRFVVMYRRVGTELNEPDFLQDWEADPEFRKMYPDLGTASATEQ